MNGKVIGYTILGVLCAFLLMRVTMLFYYSDQTDQLAELYNESLSCEDCAVTYLKEKNSRVLSDGQVVYTLQFKTIEVEDVPRFTTLEVSKADFDSVNKDEWVTVQLSSEGELPRVTRYDAK